VVGNCNHVLPALLADPTLQPRQVVDGARCGEALEQRGARAVERLGRHRNQHAVGCKKINQLHYTPAA
jgi:hypothetical protein